MQTSVHGSESLEVHNTNLHLCENFHTSYYDVGFICSHVRFTRKKRGSDRPSCQGTIPAFSSIRSESTRHIPLCIARVYVGVQSAYWSNTGQVNAEPTYLGRRVSSCLSVPSANFKTKQLTYLQSLMKLYVHGMPM
jgi:hypothetical protein